MFVLDAHCDAPSQMYRLRDFHKDNDHAHVDFPKLRAGGIGASVFAMYVPSQLEGAEATAYALKLISCVYEQIETADDIRLCFSASQLRENIASKRISILMSLENGSPIQRSLSLLRVFKQLGISSIVLTHNADNEIGDSVAGHGRWGGLSPFGREVVAEMNRLGMIVDVSHAADTTAYDCLECSKAPIIASHSSCRSLNPHRRNISDDLLRRIADGGGLVGINIFPSFLSSDFAAVLASGGLEDRVDAVEEEFIADPSDPEKIAAWHAAQDSLLGLPRPSYKLVADHIDYAVKVAGIDHVGIGTDYDGICVTPVGLENVSKLGCIFDELHSRGYSSDAIEKISGLNYLRVLSDVERLSSR